MVDTQVLSFPLHGRQSTHGHTTYVIVGQKLPQSLTLFTSQVQTDVFKCSFLRAQRSSLYKVGLWVEEGKEKERERGRERERGERGKGRGAKCKHSRLPGIRDNVVGKRSPNK